MRLVKDNNSGKNPFILKSMCKLLLLILTNFGLTTFLNGQSFIEQILNDTALNYSSIFVFSKPLTRKDYKVRDDTSAFTRHFAEIAEKKLTNKTIKEIFFNSTKPDTLRWTDDELKRLIIVQNLKDSVRTVEILRKLCSEEKSETNKYIQQAETYNSEHPKQSFYLISRPIFDNKKHFALLLADNVIEGHLGMILFQLIKGKWVEIGATGYLRRH